MSFAFNFCRDNPMAPRRLALAACLACAAVAAQAAEAAAGERRKTAPAAEAATLPAVTVQARREEEKAKDLPFTVNVINDAALEERRLSSLEDVLRGTPGVEVNSWGDAGSANVRIRGVGSLFQSGMDDSSVVVNVDGVAASVSHAGLGTLDVEQVEVLKGPQGTLFGRSSAAGAINIRTHRPELGRWTGSARAEAGSDHQHLAEGALNVPMGETLAARLALRHNAQDYGYDNRLTGKPVSRPADSAWRASLLWQPQAATHVLLRAGRHDARRYQSVMLLRPYGERPGQELDSADPLAGNHFVIEQQALEAQHDLPWARLTSVTSRQRHRLSENDYTGREVMRAWMGMDVTFPLAKREHGHNWNQELRLASLPGSAVFWVAGLDVYRAKWGNVQNRMGQGYGHDLTHNADAAFGEATWPLGASGLKLTAGLRHSRERKSYAGAYSAGAALSDARSLRERHTTGRAGLSWALTPQTSLYATLARGSKAGGFNGNATQPADSAPYRPGKVDSLELGAKHEGADGRLRLEAALFSNRVKDDHLLAFDPGTQASWMINANTRSHGLELNGHWRAGAGLTFSGGLAWISGSIRSHAVTNVPAGDVNVGNRLPDVPRLSALLAVQWQRALPAFWGLASPTLNARLSVRHVGKRANDPQNSFDLDSYRKVDLRVGIASGNAEFYIWGDNLANKQYDLYGYYLMHGLMNGAPARGRSFGLGLAYRF